MYSHIGWMVMKQNPKRIGRTDITDLNEDPVVVWQHLNFIKSVIFMGVVFPTLVAGLGWGDCLAHWLESSLRRPQQPQGPCRHGARHSGEGYHNFHHEFPSDYRNAISWWQYDPTKWSIWLWKQLAAAEKKLDQKQGKLDWGVPLEQLPVIDWDDYVEQAKNGRGLVAIAGVIHDVTDFIKDHPGGKALISSGIGKDATAIFNGGVYLHSNAAHNLLSTMRVGVLCGGCEVEIWKRAQMENKDVSYVNDSSGNRIIRAGNQPTKVPMPVASADAA
ncbi:delta-9 fatty acid desaturase [Diaporthe sp. PMI_573]|nr:delta-9 fatty acid desaturase [Diaporthaceae sp. PMI_573]